MISLEKYSYACNPNILWKVDDSNVKCGKFVSIAENVTIFLGNGIGHDSNFVTTYPFGQIYQNVLDRKSVV
jgi:acetyltransferase-like isoleucine patch superfamily enzyme